MNERLRLKFSEKVKSGSFVCVTKGGGGGRKDDKVKTYNLYISPEKTVTSPSSSSSSCRLPNYN